MVRCLTTYIALFFFPICKHSHYIATLIYVDRLAQIRMPFPSHIQERLELPGTIPHCRISPSSSPIFLNVIAILLTNGLAVVTVSDTRKVQALLHWHMPQQAMIPRTLTKRLHTIRVNNETYF